jgi:FkbM family methyltransferase
MRLSANMIAALLFAVLILRLLDLYMKLMYHAGAAMEGIRKRNKLGDGCYHVFLDVGSNIGIHGRFLYEPDLYPDSTSSVAQFALEFGYPRDNSLFCVFAFEPNPKFSKRHRDLERAYDAMGWRYKFIMAGASNADGNLTFFHSHLVDSEMENGFSALTSKTLYGTDATSRTVRIVRLASWIRNEIEDRVIPAQYSNEVSKPKVVMKLDIEGLEFKVIPDLLTTGVLCKNIDLMMGEFHYAPGNHNYYPINLTSDGRHILHNRNEGKSLSEQMLRLLDISEHCMTNIRLNDDESYPTDPHDLPSLNISVPVR